MAATKKIISPISILMMIIIVAALATLLIPAGKYQRLAYQSEAARFSLTKMDTVISLPATQKILDSLSVSIPLEKFVSGSIRKPVSIPNTYQAIPKNRQGIIEILQAPIKGVYDSIDIVFFILVIGGFMQVFQQTGAMANGLAVLSQRMKGRETWLIIILTFLFSFAGSSYGMAEEALVFYPVLVPLFLAAGYDLLVPVAVIYGGTQLGTLSSFSNPFSTIIASNAAGINWSDGLYQRIFMFAISAIIFIIYIIRYAQKVKANPSKSWVMRVDGMMPTPYQELLSKETTQKRLTVKDSILLWIFLGTFLGMIAGVIFRDWWLLEMTSLFVGATLLVGLVQRMTEHDFIKSFITGAESLLSVALIVGVARGVTIILNEGNISDSILFYAAKLAESMPPVLFILLMLGLFMVFSLFIPSSSGMAVLTMPIMGALAALIHVPGREIVNAYLYGMGIMGFLTPTGLILPSLALVQVSFTAWWKFIRPLLLILLLVCMLSLAVGIFIS